MKHVELNGIIRNIRNTVLEEGTDKWWKRSI